MLEKAIKWGMGGNWLLILKYPADCLETVNKYGLYKLLNLRPKGVIQCDK